MMKKNYSQHVTRALLASLLFSMAAGCALLDEDKKKEKKIDRFEFLKKNKPIEKTSTKVESMEEETVKISGKKETAAKAQELSAVSSKEGRLTPVPQPENAGKFYDDLLVMDNGEELSVSLIFNSAPILDVIPAFADLLNFNFVADSELKGTVTLNLNSKMTRRELWNTFERMLSLAGARAVLEDSLLRVMPLSKLAMQPGRGQEIYCYTSRNAPAKEVVAQLRPFLGKESVCIELTRPNAVLLCDTTDNMKKIKALLSAIDSSTRQNWPRLAVKCSSALPSKVVTELKSILPILGFTVTNNEEKNAIPGSIQLIGVDRLQLVVISAATKEVLEEVRKWIDILDNPNSNDREQVFIYKVAHSTAARLAQALSAIYSTTGTSLTVDTNTGTNRTSQLTSNANRNTNRNRNAAGNVQNKNNAGGNATGASDVQTEAFSNTVRVFADGVLNRLVIRTTPLTYASIKALLDRLDAVPSQVLLQVVVVEVTLNETNQFGIQLSGSATGGYFGTNYKNLSPNTQYVWTDSNGEPHVKVISNELANQNGFVARIGNPNNPNETFGFIKALAENSDVKVLSCPQLLVTSHTEAKIQVGEKVPYLSQGTSNTSSSGTILQNYEYRDTGVILTVTPQVTSTELISLDIKQELSTSKETDSSSISSPTFTIRTIETEMTIANGKTMVMGGMIQEKKSDGLDTIPIINEIPFLRRLVGNTNSTVERTEILVLVTGYIVNEKSPVEEMLKRYNDALNAINRFDQQIEKRKDPKNASRRLLDKSEFIR